MRILCLYLHYHSPDCPSSARAYSLLRRLGRDHEVTLLTGSSWRSQRVTHQFDWTPPGVSLHQLHVPYANEMGIFRRLLAYAGFPLWALIRGLRLPPPDLIYGISTPLSTGWAAASLARFYRVPWIFEVRDLWPDFPIQMGAISNPVLVRALRALEHWLYRSAAHVITLSPDMEAHVRAVAPASAVTTVAYGTERDFIDSITAADLQALRRMHDLPDTGIVLYAGTFGRANAIPTLVQTARRLQHRSDLCFVFAGHGYHESTLHAAARELPNIRLVPPQPRSRALSLFRLADVSIASFINRPVLATNAPSKLLDSLAAGTPVIVTNPGWTRRLVEQHDCGWYVPPERPDALARQLEQLFDSPATLKTASTGAAAVTRDRFDRAEHMDRLAAIVESTACAESTARVPST